MEEEVNRIVGERGRPRPERTASRWGQSSEKMTADIEQLELRLEDLEVNESAEEPLPAQSATLAVKLAKKPARRPLPAELPREVETLAPKQEACPECGAKLRQLGEEVSEVLEYVPERVNKSETQLVKV